jgi:Fic family protein
MDGIITEKPFKQPFLNQFVLASSLLPFLDKELLKLDSDLNKYEQLFLNPDIEKNLISKNELLSSFAISKAENSTLTLQEAQDVYNIILNNEDYTFIKNKLKTKRKLGQKDYEKLEFFNIAKTFRNNNQNSTHVENLTPEYIKELHKQLTQGLDIFKDHLPHFDVYKSGQWRDNDDIRIDDYKPAPYTEIKKSVEELVAWVKEKQSLTSVGIFHTAFYALHPFNNGNKRVSRVLEHILLRSLGVNTKNLYSTSYYYHKERGRYYKYLLFSLKKRNFNHFASFFQEAFVLSIISVIKTSLEVKRKEFIDRKDPDDQIRLILKHLIKRHELQFKDLDKVSSKKMARQTFVNYLEKATEADIVIRRGEGRNTYYSLNSSFQEEKELHTLLDYIKQKLAYIPDEIKLA